MRFNKVFVLAFSCLFIFLLVSCDNTGKIDKAYSYYREGEYDKALELYQVVLKRRPQDVNALKGMADVKLIQKDYAAAIENYKKATEINPEIAVSDLVSMLTYSNTEVREDATSAISQLNANKDAAISEIIKQLATASQYVKLDYLEALKRIGRDTSFVAADVLPYTDYKYPAIQQKALEALGNMDPEKLKEIGALKKMAAKMNDENQDVAETAVKSMGALKSGAADYVANVVSVIAKNNPVLTEASRKSLAEIGAASKKAVAGLVDLAGAKNPSEVRIAAINALAEMGSEANETIPDLIMILNDNDDDVHVAVVKALGKIGRASDSSVSDLVKLLKNKSDYVKMRAIAELSEMGKAASPAVSSLQQLARDSGDKEVRDEAKKAVEKISKAKR